MSSKVTPVVKRVHHPTTSARSSTVDSGGRTTTGRRVGKSVGLLDTKHVDDDEEDDDDKADPTAQSTQNVPTHAPSLRAILPKIINEQNRKTYGTWQRQLDFTRTIVGYLLGIHNFFRFPFLCFKFGGVFFIPYIIMLFVVGVPIIFVEFTIGQYYGVGSYVAFTHMSPILSGVSKLLTWSCVVNCWMYTVILAWLRIYSNDATSCLKGWEICEESYYYNTPHCFTGVLDDECNDLSMAMFHNLDIKEVMENEMLYVNFQCRTKDHFCESQGWTSVPNLKFCIDSAGMVHSIYERRYHASEEYFYGAVLGLQRDSETIRNDVLVNVTLSAGNFKNIAELVNYFHQNFASTGGFGSTVAQKQKLAKENPTEAVRNYLTALKFSNKAADQQMYFKIMDLHTKKKFQDIYWKPDAQRFTEDGESSSYKEFKQLSLTTWIMIAVFLFEDLLKISFLSYILNAVPFVILIYVTTIAVLFNYSGYGIENIFALKQGFFEDLYRLDIWTEAVVQVIYTTGIGNGVLISLATFNNINHNYNVDLYATLTIAFVTSCCGVLITFCSLGQYLKQYDIDIPFHDAVRVQSESSVEFCLIAYSIFLTLISDQSVAISLFFFMLTSFATDTAIRLVQSVLDTVMDVSPRFKYHSAVVVVAVCSMGYLVLVPMMKNGAYVLFVDLEYFTVKYMMPTIVLIEMGACVFIYKASRIIDHSEQMGVFTSYSYRVYMLICMYLSFAAVFVTVVLNISNHQEIRFNGVKAEAVTETFGWVFFISPLIMVLLSIGKQLVVVPLHRWGWLLMPLKGKDRKVRRAFLRRIQGGKGADQEVTNRTDQEEIRAAAMRWRKVESRLILAMMAKRREEKAMEANGGNKGITGMSKATPLLVSLVKIARAAKKEDDDILQQSQPKEPSIQESDNSNRQTDEEEEGASLYKYRSRIRRLGFIHVEKGGFFSRIKAAFMGKANSGKYHRPKKHAGGGVKSRIVTRESLDGSRTTNLEAEDDEVHSEESVSNDEENADEKCKERYLEGMDYVERWPGRLDESEIESEGSSLEDSEVEVADIF